jgi:hypothetical protein
MAINSPEHLTALLNDLYSLSSIERRATFDTAGFAEGRLVRLYMRYIVEKCSEGEIRGFFQGANVYMWPYGGDPNGGRVYFHYYETGQRPPCERLPYWSCWVDANDPWKPEF